MERVRLGIAGIGNVSALNAPGYLEHPSCEVLAVSDPRLDRAKAAAEAWNVPRVYGSMEELLADDDVDAVELLTPTHLHAEHAIAAARAGKRVSCQKPIANSVAEARAMIEACDRAGVMFRVTENCCFYPPLERAREIVLGGDIGEPVAIRIKTVVGQTESKFQESVDPEGYLWRFDARSPGGHLFDDVIHKYAMALWLVDSDVTSVRAVVRKGRLFFEPMVAAFEYARDGLLGTMEVSHAPGMFIDSDWYGADEFFEVQGTKGFVWVTRLCGRLHDDLPPLVVKSGRTRTAVTDIDARYDTSFRRAAGAFVGGLLSGTPPELRPEAAVKALQLAFAVYQSSNEGGPVDPATIEGSVSPSWWPKSGQELMDDVIALGGS